MLLATLGEVVGILDTLGIPNAHIKWGVEDEKSPPPYVMVVPHESNNLHTDGTVSFEARRYDLELYSKERDMPLEKRISAALRQAGIDYDTDVAVDEKGQVVITYFHATLIEQETSNA